MGLYNEIKENQECFNVRCEKYGLENKKENTQYYCGIINNKIVISEGDIECQLNE